MSNHLKSLTEFIQASPSSFHAVAEVARQLSAAGFTEVDEAESWDSDAGNRFVVRDGAIVAWRQPASAGPITPFRIVGSHTDSPGFKLKPQPTTGQLGWLQAGVEVYGGPLFNSWLDRELEFAGRLAFRDGSTALVRTGALLRFPQLAVHLDRAVNTEGLKLDPQRHLNPVVGLGDVDQADLVGHLARLAGQTAAEVAGYDISVADTQPPAVFGLDDALFASGRLDNLSSVHSSLTAFLGSSGRSDSITVLAAFDHEEVGSETRSGASGPFLSDVLTRIADGLGATASDRLRALSSSWCLSADAGHAVHPNYPEKHDPVNRPIAGAGPILKINANQRYATDALGAAEWARACDAAGVAYQEFVSNNAIPCGSTIGPLTATRLGIRTVDVGLALLSMHSARELAGAVDPENFSRAIGSFLALAD
ncbi:MAG TPA: M18 family aminopeptidase [Galbitalea sp.]|jgi:aspartyl aminopeptidase|nr:M18 family aminopeptidase [Galbitalea sp.]